jgi:hypothetical protein
MPISTGRRIAAWLVTGFGGLCLLATVGLGALALSAYTSMSEPCADDVSTCEIGVGYAIAVYGGTFLAVVALVLGLLLIWAGTALFGRHQRVEPEPQPGIQRWDG